MPPSATERAAATVGTGGNVPGHVALVAAWRARNHCVACHFGYLSTHQRRRGFAGGMAHVVQPPNAAMAWEHRPCVQIEAAADRSGGAARAHAAATREMLCPLRAAAVAIDRRAREPTSEQQERALRDWQALLAGGWVLVDHFESDRRRILIARRTDDAGAASARLARRTRQVLARRALGLSLKVIACELGVSAATVCREIARGRDALGITSAAELVSLADRIV
jgi:hypothetical protein